MAVHTCPRCDLRFQLQAEVRDHLVADHLLDDDALRPHLVPGTAEARTVGRPLIIVIGNHTLLSDALRERLQAVVGDGPADVHVVVPVQYAEEIDIGLWRGRALAERVVAPGVDVTVDAGVADPVALVDRSVHHAHVDRVLLSVLPTTLSRWMEADVAGRLRHAFGGVPVDLVTAEG